MPRSGRTAALLLLAIAPQAASRQAVTHPLADVHGFAGHEIAHSCVAPTIPGGDPSILQRLPDAPPTKTVRRKASGGAQAAAKMSTTRTQPKPHRYRERFQCAPFCQSPASFGPHGWDVVLIRYPGIPDRYCATSPLEASLCSSATTSMGCGLCVSHASVCGHGPFHSTPPARTCCAVFLIKSGQLAASETTSHSSASGSRRRCHGATLLDRERAAGQTGSSTVSLKMVDLQIESRQRRGCISWSLHGLYPTARQPSRSRPVILHDKEMGGRPTAAASIRTGDARNRNSAASGLMPYDYYCPTRCSLHVWC